MICFQNVTTTNNTATLLGYIHTCALSPNFCRAHRAQDMDPRVVKAFQDLTYEDETPLSLGEHFKQLGNDRFKRGKKNAMYFRHAQQVAAHICVFVSGAAGRRGCKRCTDVSGVPVSCLAVKTMI